MGEESAFRKKAQEWLKNNNALILSVVAGETVPNGFPDLLACWRGRFLAIEFKAEGEQARVNQKSVIKKIQDSGGLAFIACPSCWGDIKRILLDIPAREPYIYNLMYNYIISDKELISNLEEIKESDLIVNPEVKDSIKADEVKPPAKKGKKKKAFDELASELVQIDTN